MSRPWGLPFLGGGFGNLPVMHFDPCELDAFIVAHGIGAELRRAVLCPCARIETNQPRGDCRVCRGVGYTYPPSLREPIVVLMTSRDAQARDQSAGRHWQGGASATFPIGVRVARGDQVLPDAEHHVVQQTIHRAIVQVDPGSVYAMRTAPDQNPLHIPLAPDDRLLYPDALDIEHLSWISEDGESLYLGVPGVDYTRAGNRILWKPGRGPRPGSAFSVRYTAPAIWIVSESAPVFRQEDTCGLMPQKAEVRRLDRWGDPDLR